MNIITDNLKLDTGKILWNGQESNVLGAKYREILGYMPQGQGLYNGFTAKRFLNYIAVLKEVPKEEIEMQRIWKSSRDLWIYKLKVVPDYIKM